MLVARAPGCHLRWSWVISIGQGLNMLRGKLGDIYFQDLVARTQDEFDRR